MGNPEHLDILKQGSKVWNKWRADAEDTVVPDLIGAQLLAKVKLIGFNLADTRLQDANLIEADLSLTDFGGADLEGANLARARCQGVNFTGANLSRTNLSGASIEFALFGRAYISPPKFSVMRHPTDLTGTVFTNAEMTLCHFLGVGLSEAVGLASISHRSPSSVDIATLYASKGKMPSVFLQGCGVPEEFIN